jgi:hypothetical protein
MGETSEAAAVMLEKGDEEQEISVVSGQEPIIFN